MRPILYEQNERVFDTNGMGILHDAISAEVTEVRNAEFELELKYPVGGEWAQALTQNRYILVKPNDYDEPHAFRIYEIEKEVDSNQITVKGVTKTDELSGNIIKPLSIKSAIPSAAWEQLKRASVDPIEYNFISDIQTSKDTNMDIRNVLNAIAGEEGSFIDTWGGEIKRTNNTIYLYSKRGKDHVTTIRPRKNLKNVKVKSSMAGKFTRILPYVTFTPEGENEAEQVIYGDIIKSPHYDDYFVKRIVPLDLSSEFNDSSTHKEGEESKKKAPTPAQVTAKAQSYFTSKNKDADKPDLSVEVEMIPLQDSTEWDRRIIQALEKIQLCDTVDVYVPKIDCDVTVKVRKIVYDVLRERIIKIEASSSGTGRASLADQQKAQWQDLTNKIVNNALYGEKDGLIHTILTSANNKNKNFYGPEEPPREKVSKDDLWFKPVGGEGEVEMWRFDGENWVLVIDANFGQKVTDKVNDAIESAKRDINADVQAHINSAIADAEKRWRPDFTPIQNELDEKLKKLDGDINVKVSDIKDQLASELERIKPGNPNLLDGTLEMNGGSGTDWNVVQGGGGMQNGQILGARNFLVDEISTSPNSNTFYMPFKSKNYSIQYTWSLFVKNTTGMRSKLKLTPFDPATDKVTVDGVDLVPTDGEAIFELPGGTEKYVTVSYPSISGNTQLTIKEIANVDGANIYTYKWKVEEGTKATGWVPSANDGDQKWKNYKSTVDGDLASMKRRITDTDGRVTTNAAEIQHLNTGLAAKADQETVNHLDSAIESAKAELNLVPNKISTAISQYKSTVDGQISKVSTSIDQKANEIKIAAQNLEKKVDGNAASTSAELRVIKDSISAKVSRTDLDTVSGKVTAVETNLSARIDGIQTSVDKATRDVDGKITSAVSSAITQSEKEIGLRITATEAKIILDELPKRAREAEIYTDTKFNLVDGKIQTQLNNRLVDYARTTDIATRVTQEAGKIKTELTSVIDQKIPKKYGSRNFLAGTKTEIHFNGPIKNTQGNNAWDVLGGYWFIDRKTLKERGYKVGDRMNIQFKTRTTTPGITSMRVSPEIYSGVSYLQWINGSNPFGLPRAYNKDEWDVATSDTYKTKIGWFNINERALNEGLRITFRIDVSNKTAGSNVAIDIKDAMMWDGDLWTDYAPAYEDIDLDSSEKFQEVLQTVDTYKRTLGTTQNGITTSISQLIQNSDEIRTVITNASQSTDNLIVDTDTFLSAKLSNFTNGVDGYTTSNRPGNYGSSEYFYFSKGSYDGTYSNNSAFVSLPLVIDKMEDGDKYTFYCKYHMDATNAYRGNKDMNVELQIIDNNGTPVYTKGLTAQPGYQYQTYTKDTFDVVGQHIFDNVNGYNGRFSFRIKLTGEGRFGIKEIMLVRGGTVGRYKPSGGVSSTVISQKNDAWALSLSGPKDVITAINADRSGVRLKGKSIVLDGDVIANGTAFIKESWIEDLNASKITTGELNAARVKVINIDANNIVSGTMSASRVRGGELRALNDSTVFDLQSGTLNLYSNTGTIRRIDETSSSQFLKFTRSGFIAERLRDNKAAMIVLGTNHDKSENTNNESFSGLRLWSGSGNGHTEELFEVVSDRIIFYANGQYRSPWVLHNNTQDGGTFLIPMNEKGVKHYLGRGDKHFMGVYTDNLYLGPEGTNTGVYLWDLLTCFGIIARYGWNLKDGSTQNHIRGVLNKYNFR
ncbi:phage tail spike protein [Solobacterium sp.]|uniref:phage tail spike protein n=1 Tax=Solobacterium sp. TaxID=2060878 RepID=UPI001CAADFC9|nr:phage tail spike protein [Solobacterium sp.]MBF1084833.1 phage tail protein [Solobacterium sp.]